MGNQPINSACFLCGQDAICSKTDFGNRRFYKCSNPDCGEYEISGTAIDRLKHAEEFKKNAMQKAKACRDTDEILEIPVTSTQVVTASCRQTRAVTRI